MAKYIITFLGVQSRSTVYEFDGKEYIGSVFPEALIQFVEFDKMFVCVTEKAKTTTYPILGKLGDSRIESIDIADGETTDQMWQNFNEIVKKFQPGDKVIFDITHAARSIPFLTFLFSAYLKVAKGVEILNVYYGAQVFGNSLPQPSSSDNHSLETVAPKPAPVIKLGEFVSMLDWMSATQQFVDLGDGNGLVKLLKGLTIGDIALKKTFQKMAEAIEQVSDALIYIRPIEVMSAAAELHRLIPLIKGSDISELQPFLLLAEQIDDKYKKLALSEPSISRNRHQNLSCQLYMIDWYQEHRQQIKSIALARELFVSVLAYWLQRDPFTKNNRDYCEHVLNVQEKNNGFDSFMDKAAILVAWNQVRKPRNDYAHMGLANNHRSIQKLKIEIDYIINQSKKCLKEFLDSAKEREPISRSLAMARPIPKPHRRNA